jgi:hypothetical protein
MYSAKVSPTKFGLSNAGSQRPTRGRAAFTVSQPIPDTPPLDL